MNIEAVEKALADQSPEALTRCEPSAKGYALDVRVSPNKLVACVALLDKLGFFLETITGVDWLGENVAKWRDEKAAQAKAEAEKAAKAAEAEGKPAPKPAKADSTPPADLPIDDIEVVYDFNRYDSPLRVVVRARSPRDKARVPTISDIYPVAHWHERETHEFFGVKFEGHTYLVPLFLPEDADFHPLRKDFKS